ncbi:MAG: glycine cleavage system protein GcvH [Bdellovibrionota bacterium]
MKFPNDLKYSKDHEWAKVEGKNITVGVTDHAQSALGDIVFVELPAVGRQLKKGETFGVVESIKAVSDLYSPVTGKVTAVNAELTGDPAKINSDPHGNAWMIKLEITDPASMSDLMDASAYTKFVDTLK